MEKRSVKEGAGRRVVKMGWVSRRRTVSAGVRKVEVSRRSSGGSERRGKSGGLGRGRGCGIVLWTEF